MKSCKDFYDDSAQMWADNWYEDETLLPYLKSFLEHIGKKSPRVLDLCCGAGYESMRLKKMGAKVVGLDFSEKELEIAKNKNPEIEFHERNMLESYKDLGAFDGIVCIAGIVHLQGNDLKLAFDNMADVLKPDGCLLLVFREGTEIIQTTTYNDVEYNRNFVYHSRENILKAMNGNFEFVEELQSFDTWKYLFYKRTKKSLL